MDNHKLSSHILSRFFSLLFIVAALTLSCGGDGGGNVSSPNSPVISNLEYSPDTAVKNSGNGSVTIDCSFEFSDPDGNISTVTTTFFDSKGTQVATSTENIQGPSGLTSGKISGSVAAATTTLGNYTFEIYLSDASGNQSNRLTGTYTVSVTPIEFGTIQSDSATGITTDTNGNIYIIGSTGGNLDGNTNNGLYDSFLIKYDSSLTKQWMEVFRTVGAAKGVTVDLASNIYVTGYTELGLDGNTNAGGKDIYLVKYDSTGIRQWTRQLGSSGADQAESIAVDKRGNVYVTGSTFGNLDGNVNTGAGTTDIFIVKYDSSGVKQWTLQLGTSLPDYGESVAVDSNGDMYVAGHTFGDFAGNANNGGYDVLLIKLDSSGVVQWARQFGTSSGDYASGVAVDTDKNVYVTGFTEGGLGGNINAGSRDVFISKFDSSGLKQWTRQFGSAGNDGASGVAVDIKGDIYVVGSASDLWASADILLLKFNSSGTLQWNSQLKNIGGEFATSVATDLTGYIYVAGYAFSSLLGNVNAGSEDALLLKYNSSGVMQ